MGNATAQAFQQMTQEDEYDSKLTPLSEFEFGIYCNESLVHKIKGTFTKFREIHGALKNNANTKTAIKSIKFPSNTCKNMDDRIKSLEEYLNNLFSNKIIYNSNQFHRMIGYDCIKMSALSNRTSESESMHMQTTNVNIKAANQMTGHNNKIASMTSKLLLSSCIDIDTGDINNNNNNNNNNNKCSIDGNDVATSNLLAASVIAPKITDKTKQKENENMTRMKVKRDMFVALLNGNNSFPMTLLGHASIYVAYVSQISNGGENEYSARVYMIDLFFEFEKENQKQIMLSINGPCYNDRGYKCEKLILIHASMDDIINLAKKKIHSFGDYKYFTNNCQTFAKELINDIENKYGIMYNNNNNESETTYKWKWTDIIKIKYTIGVHAQCSISRPRQDYVPFDQIKNLID